MDVIILFGPPGSGKGTQSKKIAQSFGYEHISTGDILRKYRGGTDPLSMQITEIINSGNLVSDELIFQLLEKELKQKGDDLSGIILDGVPRNATQVALVYKLLEKFEVDPDDVLVISLNVSDEEVVKRLLYRATIEGRADDTLEVIENRLSIFKREMAEMWPLLQAIEVDGDGKTPEAIYHELEEIVEYHFFPVRFP